MKNINWSIIFTVVLCFNGSALAQDTTSYYYLYLKNETSETQTFFLCSPVIDSGSGEFDLVTIRQIPAGDTQEVGSLHLHGPTMAGSLIYGSSKDCGKKSTVNCQVTFNLRVDMDSSMTSNCQIENKSMGGEPSQQTWLLHLSTSST